MENVRILVVEDDDAINSVVCSYLGKKGALCTAAFSGSEGLLRLERESFDLVITDLMLPGATGEAVVAAAVERLLPSIVLSARSAVADRVGLLRIGADDYLVKPFDLEELLARCEAVLRRRELGVAAVGSEGAAGRSSVLRFGLWELDEDARTFAVGGSSVRLTRTEFEMIRLLMASPARVHTKASLSSAVAGGVDALEDKTVATHIGNIRSKLKESGTDEYIETVWGVGFKLQER